MVRRVAQPPVDRNDVSRKQPAMPRRVAALLQNRGLPFQMAVAYEVFGIQRRDLGDSWYEFRLCSATGGPIVTDGGFTITTPFGLADLEWAGTVVVLPASHRNFDPAVVDAIRRAHARGARLVSICTGALLLAQAGLLAGRRVTTHWLHADELARFAPDITVDPNVLYVDDGDIAASAGTASGIDLCLHSVRKDLGAEVSNAVARRMVVPPYREGGQAQYIADPVGVARPDGDPFDHTMEWARQHLAEPITAEILARKAAMSPRTFARHFRRATGTTLHQWLIVERVRLAQRWLETTATPSSASRPTPGLARRPTFGCISSAS